MDIQCKGTAAKTTYLEEISQNNARSAETQTKKRTRGYQHEDEADENTKSDELGVYAVEETGYVLFAKQNFSIKDRLICVYHGRQISRKKAYAKRNNT